MHRYGGLKVDAMKKLIALLIVILLFWGCLLLISLSTNQDFSMSNRLAETIVRLRKEGLPDPRTFQPNIDTALVKRKEVLSAQVEKLELKLLVRKEELLRLAARQNNDLGQLLLWTSRQDWLPQPQKVVKQRMLEAVKSWSFIE